MLKPMTILSVILLIPQVPTPVGSQTLNSKSQVQSVQNKTRKDPDKAPTSTLQPEKAAPEKPQNANDSSATEKAKEPEKITDHQRDWLDYITLCINSILACVGAAGVFAAWRGLPGIFRQAKATEDAANAAKESAEATLKQVNIAINADRAWVFVSVAHWEFTEEDEGDGILYHVKVTIELENFGKTPAFLISAQCGASFAKSFAKVDDESILSSFDDAYQVGDVERLPLPPGKQVKVVEATSADSLDKAEWQKFVNVGGYWYRPPIAYGVIRYRDAYGNERTTKFCLARWKDGARIVGPPGVNSYT
jgi:hypothetical protein